jgi:hypothetical protein
MPTALDIIENSFRDVGILGVGQTLLAEDANNALLRMNSMIAQWRRKRWLVYQLISTGFTSTGANSYTVGPAGNYALSPRPDKIESAFVRQLNSTPGAGQVDTPLIPIASREEYNLLAIKTLGAMPAYFWYDPGFPTGTLYPWPVPQASLYAVHITTKIVLPAFTNLTTDMNLPAEYEAALQYQLNIRLAPAYGRRLRADLIGLAKDALLTVRAANAAISPLLTPGSLIRNGRYNIHSDQAT